MLLWLRSRAMAGLCALLAGCAARSGLAPGPHDSASRTPPPTPTSRTVSRIVVTPSEALTLDELLARARALLAHGRADEAAREFDRVASLDQEGKVAPAALLEGAEAYEAAGDPSAAADRLEGMARRFPRSPLARGALVRAVRERCYLEQWGRAGILADLLLTSLPELGPLDRIVVYAGKALSLAFAGDPDRAADWVDRGRVLVDDLRLDAAGRVPRDLAQLYFALGEVRSARAERIRFQPFPADFPAVLESRCQLLLDAQSAYSDAMRAYDAHWSAMAGVRVGQLYQRLHQDLMAIEPPATADTPARRQLFEGAIRLRYSVLLDKAMSMMEHTLSMARRTGEKSRWVLEAERAEHSLAEARRTEQQALARLPYTRAELERELERQAELGEQVRRARAAGLRADSPEDAR